MSLTVYARARAVYAASSAAADGRASAIAHVACAAYDSAREQYNDVAARYDARVTHTLPPADDLEVMCDLATYTSSRAPDMLAYYDDCPRRPDTRAIDAELRRRAEQRRRADVQAATAEALERQATSTPTSLLQHRRAAAHTRTSRMLAHLQQRQRDEFADLCDLEQQHFRVLAKAYYDSVFGAIDELRWCEAQARQALVDAEVDAALTLLARLRDELVACEQRRLRRGMGLDDDYVQQRRREAAAAAEAAARAACVLDSMQAVPLMQRALAIRQETLNEEDMAFRYLTLAFDTQADLIADGYVRYHATRHTLERHPDVRLPLRKHEAAATAFQLALYCLELCEESARMRLVDAAVDDETELCAQHTRWLLAYHAAHTATRALPWQRPAITASAAVSS